MRPGLAFGVDPRHMLDAVRNKAPDAELLALREENAHESEGARARPKRLASEIVTKSPTGELALEACVLFVDDDPPNLVVWEAICSDELTVLTAQSADEALVLMSGREVGVLVTDQRMPGTTGVDLLEKVRTQYPDTIRMLVTAYSDLAAAVDAINRGHVRRFLRKPVEPALLKAELRDALDVYLTNRKLRALECRLFETERVYALGVVVAGIGSELKTPLHWVSRNLQAARETLSTLQSKDDAARVRSWLKQIEDVLSEVGQGISHIEDVVRGIELPTVEHEEDLIDMSEVIRLTLRLVSAELRRATSLELDVRPVPLVRGASTLLGQVVLNLMVNAMQSVRMRPRTLNLVSIRLSHDDTEVRLEVADNGARISGSDVQSVFDPFFTPSYGRGAGLGLAISRTIAEQHGGRLEVANRPDGGVLFRFVLPVAN
jgi:two-component system NtrC family sensor kinase